MPKPIKKSLVTVKQSEENPIATEIIAQAIVQVADGMRHLRGTRLSNRAIHILIQDACPASVSIANIKMVLDGAESLEETYLKK